MPHIVRRSLTRKIDEVQDIAVLPKDAEPVAFLNRGGEPTVYFHTAIDAPDIKEGKRCQFMLTSGEGRAPKNAVYIGTAEFSSGLAIFHCWGLQ